MRVKPGLISSKSIKKMRKKKINVYQARENLELAISKAEKELGLKLVGYDAETFLKRNKN